MGLVNQLCLLAQRLVHLYTTNNIDAFVANREFFSTEIVESVRALERFGSSQKFDQRTIDQNIGWLKPEVALDCLKDRERTVGYAKAIRLAVDKLVCQKREGELVEIVDAGSGPLPIFAIFAAISSPTTRVRALEIDPLSARIAKEIVLKLGLQDRITVINCDAQKYSYLFETGKKFDLLVTETMTSALAGESMRFIFENLAPQVVEGGLTIPRAVTIDLLLKSDADDKREFLLTKDAPLYRLSKDSFLEHSWRSIIFDNIPIGNYKVYLRTTVDLFSDDQFCVVLSPNKTSITGDIRIGAFLIDKATLGIETYYVPNSDPYFDPLAHDFCRVELRRRSSRESGLTLPSPPPFE
ncbi:MAG TPA: hypothetical protein PKA79_03745 [Oligoflexia bacterium]|nr:hypothetical protein [Oligoflexia bacterium]